MSGTGISLTSLFAQALQLYAGRAALAYSGQWDDTCQLLKDAPWIEYFVGARHVGAADGDQPAEAYARQLAISMFLEQLPGSTSSNARAPQALALGAGIVIQSSLDATPTITLAVHCDRGTGQSTVRFNELGTSASVLTTIGAGLVVLLEKTIDRDAVARWNFDHGCRVSQRVVHADPLWTDVLAGGRSFAEIAVGSVDLGDRPVIVFPGAFDPLHEGHLEMARLAAARLGRQVAFELSIFNAAKKPLDFIEIDRRRRQSFYPHNLLLTNAATFDRKAKLFPGATFMVGADTIQRISDPKYYANQPAARDTAIDYIARRDCRFLVFGREFDGQYHSMSNLVLTPRLKEITDEVSEAEFRTDVASRHLRS